MAVFPLVVDLSHHDPAVDYGQVKKAGILGVIYKATQGATFTDATYVRQQHAAKTAGLLWGAYHFADGSSVNDQIDNFLKFASPDPDELFCLDWEGSGAERMSLANVKIWIDEVEKELKRPNQCVLYSGNVVKELVSSFDAFLGARRLWIAQYSSAPVWPRSWKRYWLWQFTDGESGPFPHNIPGIGDCDINSYDNGATQLAAEWATGSALASQPPTSQQPALPQPVPPQPAPPVAAGPPVDMGPPVASAPAPTTIEIVIVAPPGVTVKLKHAVETPIQ